MKILTYEKKFNFNKIIDQIQNVRKKIIKIGWIFLRLAFKSNPKKASKILSSIYKKIKKLVI